MFAKINLCIKNAYRKLMLSISSIVMEIEMENKTS